VSDRPDHPEPSRPREANEARGAPQPRRRALDASVLVGLLSVAVALVFSAIQSRDSARQLRLNQQSSALTATNARLSALFDLHAKIVDADKKTSDALQLVRATHNDPKSVAKLIEAVTPLEGIAYLLRHHQTGIPGASEIWKRYLVCSFYTARAGVSLVLDDYVPELARFATAQQRTLGPDRRCLFVIVPKGG
jgi:hypothetical protein